MIMAMAGLWEGGGEMGLPCVLLHKQCCRVVTFSRGAPQKCSAVCLCDTLHMWCSCSHSLTEPPLRRTHPPTTHSPSPAAAVKSPKYPLAITHPLAPVK